MAHHLAINRTKSGTLRTKNKIQWNMSQNNVFIQEMQLCFCNIIEHAKGSFMLRLILSCLILPFSDLNECQSLNGGCAHQCNNTHGSYHCMCRDGFRLRSDNHGCDSKSSNFLPIYTLFLWSHLAIYSFSNMILWSLEAVRFGDIIIESLCNLTGISVVLLPRCLSNFRAIGKV